MRTPTRCVLLLLAASTLLYFPTVHAGDIYFSGFGTVAGGRTLDSNQAYHGMTDEISYTEYSLFAVQANVEIDLRTSAIAQFVARGKDDFQAEAEWAYLNFAITDKLHLKAGRMRNPVYHYSEFLEVGYAYHWLIPPDEVYQTDVTRFDGIQLSYSHFYQNLELQFSVSTGSAEDFVEPLDSSRLSLDYSLNINALYQNWQLGLMRQNGTVDLIDEGLQTLESIFPEYQGSFQAEDNTFNYYAIYLHYEHEHFFVGTEYAHLTKNDYSFSIPEQERFMLTAGINIGAVNLHATSARKESLTDTNPLNQADPRYQVMEGFINAEQQDSRTQIYGVRYDFSNNLAFKFDMGTTVDKRQNNQTDFFRTGLNYVF